MLKVKEILLKFQEDTKFIEKVANSNTIDKLYEVFCEYEYDSDINSFESEIYELLRNSNLIKGSIDEEELAKVSGGECMRKKIMSVIMLSALAMGDVTPFSSHIKAEVIVDGQPKKHAGDTILPIEEWVKLGLTILGSVAIGGIGYGYHRYRTRNKYNYAPANLGNGTPSPLDIGGPNGNAGAQPSSEDNCTPKRKTADYMLPIYNFDGEKGFEKALECIETWHKNETDGETEFPPIIVAAVDKIDKTFFPNEKPEPMSAYGYETSLKLFPNAVENCTQHTDEYFVPLSWNAGNGDFDKEDSFMLHKVLFQYLCRMLCFVLSSDTASTWPKEQHYVYYLEGKDRFDKCVHGPDYTSLFAYMTEKHGVCKEYQRVTSQVNALIKTLASMYEGAIYHGHRLTKCGVFCGETPRTIDN